MKNKKWLAATLSAAVVLSSAPSVTFAKQNFRDVLPTDAGYTEIQALANQGIITGFPDGTFKPYEPICRGQAAVIFQRALKLKIPQKIDVFKDVKSDQYYAKAIAATKAANIFNGRENGMFYPEETMTREEMASLLVRAFKLKAKPEVSVPFKDLQQVSPAHVEDVKILAQNKIALGNTDGTFDPKGNVTRQQFSIFLYRTMEKAKEKPPGKPPVDKPSKPEPSPVKLVSASTSDSNRNGKMDRMYVTFSDRISTDSVSMKNFQISGYQIESITAEGSSVLIRVKENSSWDRVTTPVVKLTGNVTDEKGRILPKAEITAIDNITPLLASTTIKTSKGNKKASVDMFDTAAIATYDLSAEASDVKITSGEIEVSEESMLMFTNVPAVFNPVLSDGDFEKLKAGKNKLTFIEDMKKEGFTIGTLRGAGNRLEIEAVLRDQTGKFSKLIFVYQL